MKSETLLPTPYFSVSTVQDFIERILPVDEVKALKPSLSLSAVLLLLRRCKMRRCTEGGAHLLSSLQQPVADHFVAVVGVFNTVWQLPDLWPDSCGSERRHAHGVVGNAERFNALEDLGPWACDVGHVELLVSSSCDDHTCCNLFIICTPPHTSVFFT
jgi:hypothetical protein